MVREGNRNIDRTKVQEPDIDSLGNQQTNRTPNYTSNYRSYTGGSRSGSAMTDVASGLALVLSVIAFFFSSYAVIQAVSARRQSEGVRPPTSAVPNSFSGTGGGSNPANTDATRRIALTTPPRVEPGRYVQPTYGGSGRVEILSAQRVGGLPASNLVNVRLRFERAASPTGGEIPINGGGDIKLDDAIAINTRTNQTFPVVRYQNPGDEPISLYRLRPGEATEATITLRVPERLNRIDLRIPATDIFRNVPIAAPV
jgi:hypothetical protein